MTGGPGLLVTGGSGFLGTHVIPRAEAAGWRVVAPPSREMDVTDPAGVRRMLREAAPAAVLIRDDRPLVFKRNDDRAQWLYVTTGLENADWIEILEVHSGGTLAPGDRVVVSDHLTLAHEAKIDIREDLPPADRWAAADGE